MDLGLKDKRALVLASSQGLGRGIAEALAAEGARLMLASRRADAIARVADETADKYGTEAVGRACDLSSVEEAGKLGAAALEHFGGVDVFVGNYGGPPPGKISQVAADDWRAWFETMLLSLVTIADQVLPGMRERGWGRILIVTSAAVKQPIPHLGISNALRAGVTGWAKTLSDEVGPDGVTVNTIMPGRFATDRMIQNIRHAAEQAGETFEAHQAKSLAAIPLRRLGTPEEFGAMAAFLCSTQASYVTGAAIPVDGGVVKALY